MKRKVQLYSQVKKKISICFCWLTYLFSQFLPAASCYFDPWYYTLFQSLHQTIMTFSKSYWQTILQTFPEFISRNTDILSNTEFLPKQTIVKLFSEFISHNTDTFKELLPNNIDLLYTLLPNSSNHFFKSFNEHSNWQKILKEKIPK